MAEFEITRTELVWPGKYNEDGARKDVPRVTLPFQVIETVNQSRATRETKKVGVQGTLFDVYDGKEGDTYEDGWRNKLIWGDNLLVMGSLLEKFAGKVDLIYIDPPFATGADFSVTAEIGESGAEIIKEQSAIEEKAYRDTWGRGQASWLDMMAPRLELARLLLSDRGSLVLHLDWRMSGAAKLVLDEIFGSDHFQNEIIWRYRTYQGHVSSYFPRKHDSLLWYRAGPSTYFKLQYQDNLVDTIAATRWADYIQNGNEIRGDRYPATDSRFDGYIKRWVREHGREPGPDDVILTLTGYVVDDVWEDIQAVDPKDKSERLGYPTQKPEALLARVIRSFSSEDSIVADFFAGSGTTLAVAEKLGRRWIGCDLGRWSTHVTRKRLLGIENCKPFEVLNLGKYERQYWQGVTFGDAKEKPLTEQALYEYLAFILRLYGAQPVVGLTHLHGKKGKALIHIGAVDAPVTISEIDAAVDECAKLKQGELHVLGWEWEMGLYDLMVEAAKKKGVKLLLFIIPREVMEQQAAAKGDVRFFELAYLEADITLPEKLTAQVALKDFVIPNTELIPDEVRSKVTKWSDFIDYWAVDWDFRDDTFMQGWVAYRTRKDRRLPLTSDSHTYEKPGRYRLLVKVIDIFGNDTSQAFDAEVK